MSSARRLPSHPSETVPARRPPFAQGTIEMEKLDDAVRFVAPDGTYWAVYEISDHRGTTPVSSLIFVSDEGFRRVRRYPAEWRALEPRALWMLSWER